jgi:FkbM family methyltransferase
MIQSVKYYYRAYRLRYKIDTEEIKYMISRMGVGDTVIDIGSHKGGYLYWMQKSVTKTGKVYGFEPQRSLFIYLNRIIKRFKYDNMIIENMGVSSREDVINFYIPKTRKGNSPEARIDLLQDGGSYQKTKIRTTTLDKYFFDCEIYPDFIKIDAEGHEKQILLGGLNLLKTHQPKILMECENRHMKEGKIFDVFDILLKLGYRGYFFENRNLKPIHEFNTDIHQKRMSGRFWEANGYINNFFFEKPR